VNNELKLRSFSRRQREAKVAFGNERMLRREARLTPIILKCIFFGDQHGHVMPLFERGLSIQRRHQKVIEFAPSLASTPEQRERLCGMAVTFRSAAGYQNAANRPNPHGSGQRRNLSHRNEHAIQVEHNRH